MEVLKPHLVLSRPTYKWGVGYQGWASAKAARNSGEVTPTSMWRPYRREPLLDHDSSIQQCKALAQVSLSTTDRN
jgi:hypothetical protein